MTPEEITKLVEEYVEEIYPHEKFEDIGQMDFLRNTAKKNVASFIRWLLRSHCIVSKEKVRDEYETSKHYFEATDNSNPTQKQYFYGRMTVFESLFDAETFKNSEV